MRFCLVLSHSTSTKCIIHLGLIYTFQNSIKYVYGREYQRDIEERKKAALVSGASIVNVPKEYGYVMPFDDFKVLKGWHDSLKESAEKKTKFVSQGLFNFVSVYTTFN